MPKRILYLIIFSGILRMIVAAMLELSNDEVYYYLYALDLQYNYFDHPPGVGVLIRLFTANLTLTQELFVRLGAIVCTAIGTALAYQLGKLLKDEQTGWLAAVFYNTSIYTSVIAGTFIIPDSPQVVFWLASLLVMLRIITLSDDQKSVSLPHWLLFGVLTGLCILCKVHGVFIWFGFGLYILIYQRRLLASPGLYISALVTLVTISPIVLWNIQNDFITYKFHSGRVGVEESPIHLDYFLQALGGQLLYNNPINAFIIIISLWKLRSVEFLSSRSVRFILLNGLPIILVVTVMSVFNSMLPHWSGPGFMVMGFLAAGFLSSYSTSTRSLPGSLRASVYLITGAFVIAALLIKFYPGTLGFKDEAKYGEGDFTLDMYGWKQFANEFTPWLAERKKSQALADDVKIVSHKWFPAAHLDYYLALPAGITLTGVGDVNDLHQYFWLNRDRRMLRKGEDALCIVPSNYSVNLDEAFLPYFESAELLKTFENKRGGELVRYFRVYRLNGYRENDEMRRNLGTRYNP